MVPSYYSNRINEVINNTPIQYTEDDLAIIEKRLAIAKSKALQFMYKTIDKNLTNAIKEGYSKDKIVIYRLVGEKYFNGVSIHELIPDLVKIMETKYIDNAIPLRVSPFSVKKKRGFELNVDSGQFKDIVEKKRKGK